jgi:hypothetical protein
MCNAQGLDIHKAKCLNFTNCESFYDNLKALCDQHKYPPFKIWNVDEMGVQARS